jgi:hypothetical protein
MIVLDIDNFTNSLGYILPMKAKPFIADSMEYPCAAQRKYNGIRGDCQIITTKTDDLFSETKIDLKLLNKTGDRLYIAHIQEEASVLKAMLHIAIKELNLVELDNLQIDIEDIHLDGEFYIHGLPLGQINGACNNKDNFNHKDLTFVVFDLKLQVSQNIRLLIISKLKEINVCKHIKFTSFIYCDSDDTAFIIRNQYISECYEGVILRNLEAIYQPKRTKDMLKYKALKKILCQIIDVVPYKKNPELGMFKVLDLSNDTICETTIRSSSTTPTNVFRTEVIINKSEYIGKYVMVEYRERTEEGKLFHTNAIWEEIQTNYNN